MDRLALGYQADGSHILLETHRAAIAQSGMQPLAVVDALNPLEECLPHRPARGPCLAVDQFGLEGGKEPFGNALS